MPITKGDKVKVNAQAFYQGTASNTSINWNAFFYVNPNYGSGIINGENITNPNNVLNMFGVGIIPTFSGNSTSVPKSYLIAQFFDKNNISYKQIIRYVNVSHQNTWLSLPEINEEVLQNGRVEIFVANESNIAVFFDNLTITHLPTLISQENHYYAFGMNAKEIEKEGSNRFQYNSKEKESFQGLEWNDYGARSYDSEVGRWWGVDAKAEKFESFSSYHYAYSNPIITIDSDGNENIVVVGGADVSNRNRYNFIQTGLKQLEKYISNQPKEKNTMAVFSANMTNSEMQSLIYKVFDMVNFDGAKVSIEFMNNDQELTNYINSGDRNFEDISQNRKNDKITDVAMFGHGYAGSFEPGHSASSDIQNKFSYGLDDISKINSKAFANGCKIDLYSCNSATDYNSKGSFAEKLSTKAKDGIVSGWYGLTSYHGINNPDSISIKILKRILGSSPYHPSDNLPNAYQGAEKKQFKNGNEIK
ncbi:MAG: hypothetical protein EAZ06_10180 [Cytophagales bacterium]|nr:MAG: hypothetical protein EAZ06_10180 [Cytophagales bacterium]